VHSLLLAVNPGDPEHQGFLGGTVLGREFWRGLRSGGDVGAKNFKNYCLKGTEASTVATDEPTMAAGTIGPVLAPVWKRSHTNTLKTEVYANVRNALRL
jgi:hypothetical protein